MKRILVCLFLLLAGPVAAEGPTYLRIGSTGIFCIMAPCPSFGLIPTDGLGNDIAQYAGEASMLMTC